MKFFSKKLGSAAAVMVAVFFSLFSQAAMANTTTRWEYSCANGQIHAETLSPYSSYNMSNMYLQSHTNQTWGDGYSSTKTLSNAVSWCRGLLAAQAKARCDDLLNNGADSGSWTYQAQARLLRVSWSWYQYYNEYGQLVTTYSFPAIISTQSTQQVSGSGDCGWGGKPGPFDPAG